MKTKVILQLLSPILVLALVTIIGVLTHSPKIIATCGLTLFLLCFWCFAAVNKLGEQLKALRIHTAPKGDWRRLLDTFQFLCVRFSLLVRGFFLSASIWIVDLYLSLCRAGLLGFAGKLRENFLITALTMSFAAIDTSRGKSISQPGVLARIVTAYGAFQFLKNMFLLISVLDTKFFDGMEKLFSSPIWFVEDSKYELFRFSISHAPILAIIGVGTLVVGITFLIGSKSKADSKSFGVGWIAFGCWALTLPGFYVYVLLYGFPSR